MRFFTLLPLLLVTGAFAGRIRRQTPSSSSVDAAAASPRPACPSGSGYQLCRGDDECTSSERCAYQTRDPSGQGCSGACVPRLVTPSDTFSASSPTVSSGQAACPVYADITICRVDTDCGTGNRCQFVTRNPDGSGCDGQCYPITIPSSSFSSSFASAPSPSASLAGCSGSPYGQVCRDSSTCNTPGNEYCIKRGPSDTQFGIGCNGYCGTEELYSSNLATASSTFSTSATSTVSANPSTSTCGVSGGTVICRGEEDCGTGQRCQFVTRNPNMSGCDGYCVDVAPISSSSTSSSSAAVSSSMSSAAVPSGSALPRQCTYNLDCPLVTTYCNQQSQCVPYNDCRAVNGSCPGGVCAPAHPLTGPTNQAIRDPYQPFICNFTFPSNTSTSISSPTSIISSSTVVVSSSPAVSSEGGKPSAGVSVTPGPSVEPHPAPSSAVSIVPAPTPGPSTDSHPAPSTSVPPPAPSSDVHPAPPAPTTTPAPTPDAPVPSAISAMPSMVASAMSADPHPSTPSSAAAPPPPAPSSGSGPGQAPSPDTCTDLSNVLAYLKDIKYELECLKKDVQAIKDKVGA